MREILNNWGRRDLGFAWLFLEPLLFAFPVLTVWSMVRSPFERGVPLVPFLWTGYLPLLMFRHVTGSAMRMIGSNGAMLYHRSITPLDMYVGGCGLQALGSVLSMAASYLVLHSLGFLPSFNDFGLFLGGIGYMVWWSMAVALILCPLSERFEPLHRFWAPVSYLYIFVCGMFFLLEWLPEKTRNFTLLLLPPVHASEMMRAGLIEHITPYYDLPYVTFYLGVLTFIGLWMMRSVRLHIDIN